MFGAKINLIFFNFQMPQLVPSAGFTPPCDYSNFAETFDLSLLPGSDYTLSPQYNLLYTQSPPPAVVPDEKPKVFPNYYSNNSHSDIQKKNDIDLGPDFQTLLPESTQSNLYPPSPNNGIYLEVPSSKNYHANSPIGALSPYSPQSLLSPNEQYNLYQEQQTFYPNSPDVSLYNSPNSYARSSREDFVQTQYIKKENSYQSSPMHNAYSCHIKEENYLPSSPEYSKQSPIHNSNIQQIENTDVFELLKNTLLEKQVKQESTVDFSNLLEDFAGSNNSLSPNNNYKSEQENSSQQSSPQDHQLLREVLRDTSFQKKYNIKPIDFGFMTTQIKMEEPDETVPKELISQEQLVRESIEPALNLAIEARIEEMRKDADSTCTALNISPDASQWTSANVWSWLQWTCRELSLPALSQEQWDLNGASLLSMTEDDFTKRAPQGGSMIYAQLEIWKAACMDESRSMQWMPETTSSNASSGDMSDDEEEESSTSAVETKPTTSRSTGGSHIHLWQFLKELLASPQIHGSCIRWLDRTNGVFKIEDSVKVARLWGKRKNRPAMNYDKLSRSIRQYYKKGIMKKTERSQRLVYQFCHPYCL
ncbi:ets [Holotrichia oblita]|uniref:Ets n=1 Tax=Holotrichia oblita TaxID=644536 RepID=A0ACB9T742_HOLOL|nr:ets [Holotrichia oblita]